MRTLIVYSTATGTVKKCAEMLAEKLPGAELADLKERIPDPGVYDTVIVGGYIRGGGLCPKTAAYLENCEEILLGKKLGLFLCCGMDEKAGELLGGNISEALLSHAAAAMSFGGELDPSRARGIDRFMLKMMAKGISREGGDIRVFPERIAEFAERIGE